MSELDTINRSGSDIMSPPLPRLVSARTIANSLDVSLKTVHNWSDSGLLGTLVITKTGLKRWYADKVMEGVGLEV